MSIESDQESIVDNNEASAPSQQSLSFYSSIGNFYQGEAKPELEKDIYLEYPGVRDLLNRTKQALANNKKITFKLPRVIKNTNLHDDGFLCFNNEYTEHNADLFAGCPVTHFNSLLTQNIAGQTILGNSNLAYIEARTSYYFHKYFHNETAVDHFYFTEGIANINLFDETIKAHDINKNEVAVMLIPNNAIKAFRRSRFSGWQLIETGTRPASFAAAKIYQVDQNRNVVSEINLVEQFISNLEAPIYKVKLGERWVVAVPYANDYQSINKTIELNLSQPLLDSIINHNKHDKENESTLEVETIEASIGQTARAIFNLLGGDYELLPEALLNLEGGSWSAIATEKSASGKHTGTNSMHEVIKNGWHKHPEVAIPWNYLSWDRATEESLNNPNNFILAFHPGSDLYIESPQTWKKTQADLIQYVLKTVYREYSVIASKKYLLSAKEQIQVAAKYLAKMTLKAQGANAELLDNQHLHEDLEGFLQILFFAHCFASAKGDFYSSKTHPCSLKRLGWLSLIEKQLEKFCPITAQAFKKKVWN